MPPLLWHVPGESAGERLDIGVSPWRRSPAVMTHPRQARQTATVIAQPQSDNSAENGDQELALPLRPATMTSWTRLQAVAMTGSASEGLMLSALPLLAVSITTSPQAVSLVNTAGQAPLCRRGMGRLRVPSRPAHRALRLLVGNAGFPVRGHRVDNAVAQSLRTRGTGKRTVLTSPLRRARVRRCLPPARRAASSAGHLVKRFRSWPPRRPGRPHRPP